MLGLIEPVGFKFESAQREQGIEEAHMVFDPGPARHLDGFLRGLMGEMELAELEQGSPSNTQKDCTGSRVGNAEPSVAGGNGGGRVPVVKMSSGGDDRELVKDEVRARLHARKDITLKCNGGLRVPAHPLPVRDRCGHPDVEGALAISIVVALTRGQSQPSTLFFHLPRQS